MSKLKPPTVFDPTAHPSDTVKAFDTYIRQWKLWYRAECMDHLKPDAPAAAKQLHQANYFRASIASNSRLLDDIIHEYGGDESLFEEATFDDMIQKLRDRYKPTQNQVLLHYEFNSLNQQHDEKIDTFINRIKEHARQCDFKCASNQCNVKDTLIRDRIIIGTHNRNIREDALEKEYPLPELEKQARKIEATETAAKQMTKPHQSSLNADLHKIDTAEHMSPDDNDPRVNALKPGHYSRRNRSQPPPPAHHKNPSVPCIGCGNQFCRRDANCPARGQKCNGCGIVGHFRRCCKKMNQSRNRQQNGEQIHSITTDLHQSYITPYYRDEGEHQHYDPSYIYTVATNNRQSKHVQLNISGQPTTFMIDSGAEVNVILQKHVPRNVQLTPTKITLHPYASKPIFPIGEFVAPVSWGKVQTAARWIVLDNNALAGRAVNILSCPTAEELGILTINTTPKIIAALDEQPKPIDPSTEQVLAQYESVFTGMGKMKTEPVQLYTKPIAKPIIQPPRPIPYHLQEQFRAEIKEMENNDIIEEHVGPVTWISNPVIVPKPTGGFRVTVDLRQVNKVLENTHLPIPRVEDILPSFSGKKVFSKLDLKSAYHQIELHPSCRHLTVFRAGNRLMRYKRLTMGSLPASGELNNRLKPLIETIPDADIIHDDIVISSPNLESHNATLHQVLTVLRESGLTLNRSKCIFSADSIPFWGFIVTADGLKPDPEKCQALQTAERPRTKEELTSFLCMIRSNGDFIPDLATMTANLRAMTAKNATFCWTDAHDQEFENVKSAFNSSVLLRHYDPEQPTFIFVDAHRTGLSAILTQGQSIDKTKAVALASRATTVVERKYAQLDLEALAVDFGLRRFQHYLIGGPPTTIVTDHQPLESLWKTNRRLSLRLERIQLRHQHINYTIQWKKGKDNPADYLSRHAIPLEQLPQRIAEEARIYEKLVYTLHTSRYTTALTPRRILLSQQQDPDFQNLSHHIHLGRAPENDPNLKPYCRIFPELTISDGGLILRGDKILLPPSLQEEAVMLAHQGSHPGCSQVTSRVRSHFWFPQLNTFIEQQIQQCHACQIHTPSHKHAPLTSAPLPSQPWENVSLDLFGPLPNQHHILVARCNQTKFPDARVVKSTAAKDVIPALARTYNNFGNPHIHKSDNGPPFNSSAFQQFSDNRGILVKHTMPYHPQANEAECFMKPLGKAVKIAVTNKQPIQDAVDDLLQSYRATPSKVSGLTPGELMFRGGYKSLIVALLC